MASPAGRTAHERGMMEHEPRKPGGVKKPPGTHSISTTVTLKPVNRAHADSQALLYGGLSAYFGSLVEDDRKRKSRKRKEQTSENQ